jgi:GNAT superfamily N-acetyltransferase
VEFTVRPAARADIPAMHRIRTAVRENRLSEQRRITGASYLPYVAAGTAWVAEAAPGVVGFAALDAQDGSVWALFVDPEFEGAGIGQALHAQMLHWAAAQRLERLSLETERGSRAELFYKRAGWTEVGAPAGSDVVLEKLLGA